VHHLVKEVAVVGHHHHRALPAIQIAFQPLDGLQIQVVGRLVQQQQASTRRVGEFQEEAGQKCACLLAATQVRQGHVVLFRWEAQAYQHMLGPILVGIATQVLEPIAQGTVGFQGGFGAIGIGHFRLQSVKPSFEGAQRLKDRHHLLPEGVVALHRGPLRQVADGKPFGALDPAIGGWLQSGQDAQQRGLARPVAPHQGDAVPMGDAARHIPKDILWIKRFGNSFRYDNRHATGSRRAHYITSLAAGQFGQGQERRLLAGPPRGTMAAIAWTGGPGPPASEQAMMNGLGVAPKRDARPPNRRGNDRGPYGTYNSSA
jgi:hypothetical protein